MFPSNPTEQPQFGTFASNQLHIMNKNAPNLLEKQEADFDTYKLTSMEIVSCNSLTERAKYQIFIMLAVLRRSV